MATVRPSMPSTCRTESLLDISGSSMPACSVDVCIAARNRAVLDACLRMSSFSLMTHVIAGAVAEGKASPSGGGQDAQSRRNRRVRYVEITSRPFRGLRRHSYAIDARDHTALLPRAERFGFVIPTRMDSAMHAEHSGKRMRPWHETASTRVLCRLRMEFAPCRQGKEKA